MKKLVFLFFVLLLSACSNTASGGDFPSKNVEIIAPASPGGGWDITARSVQKILTDNELVDTNINVMNKPGGGGEVGWTYLDTKDAHHLAINSSLLLTNNLLGTSQLTYNDFTPLATLATEWQSLAVPIDSEYETLDDLMAQLKADPKSIKVGVGPALGNDDHLSFVQAVRENDIDPKQIDFLVYEGGGDVATALLGGHVDVVTTSVSEVKELHLAGDVKILAVSSEERVAELEDVPTYKEQGIDMVFPHWRGIMGPADMSEEEIAYWDEKLGEMVKSEEWQEVVKNNDWEAFYQNSKETKAFLDEQQELYKGLVDDSGLVQ